MPNTYTDSSLSTLTNAQYKSLLASPLLRGLTEDELTHFISSLKLTPRTYPKDSFIAITGEPMEGLAARLTAERGVAPALLAEAHACLDAIDATLAPSTLDDEGFSRYVELNARFHLLLSRMVGSDVVARELDRVKGLPFASPSAFVVVQTHSAQARDMLVVAQDQHRQALDAIERREGARAEAILREHSRITRRNLLAAVQASQVQGLPGVQLIRERA